MTAFESFQEYCRILNIGPEQSHSNWEARQHFFAGMAAMAAMQAGGDSAILEQVRAINLNLFQIAKNTHHAGAKTGF